MKTIYTFKRTHRTSPVYRIVVDSTTHVATTFCDEKLVNTQDSNSPAVQTMIRQADFRRTEA